MPAILRKALVMSPFRAYRAKRQNSLPPRAKVRACLEPAEGKGGRLDP